MLSWNNYLMNIKMANNKGFTLIEIIIVIIVLSILSIFGFHFLSTGIHTYSMMEKQKGLFDQATMVVERISRELRDADSIITATGSELEFTKSHGTNEEVYDAVTDVITFQLSVSTLQRERVTTAGTTTVNIADNVSAFTVTNSSNEITISLTLESGEASITLRSYICPKNLQFSDPGSPSGRNFGGFWEEDIQ